LGQGLCRLGRRLRPGDLLRGHLGRIRDKTGTERRRPGQIPAPLRFGLQGFADRLIGDLLLAGNLCSAFAGGALSLGELVHGPLERRRGGHLVERRRFARVPVGERFQVRCLFGDSRAGLLLLLGRPADCLRDFPVALDLLLTVGQTGSGLLHRLLGLLHRFSAAVRLVGRGLGALLCTLLGSLQRRGGVRADAGRFACQLPRLFRLAGQRLFLLSGQLTDGLFQLDGGCGQGGLRLLLGCGEGRPSSARIACSAKSDWLLASVNAWAATGESDSDSSRASAAIRPTCC
jgi:hypothetical protein